MATTKYFGLNSFGAEGNISDEGFKFSNRDRQTIDALLFSLFSHDHRSSEAGQAMGLGGPAHPPVLTQDPAGGQIPAGTTYFYRIAFVDDRGNETAAVQAAQATTPAPLPTPGTMSWSVATVGGALESGTYRYAVAYYQDAGGVTRATNTFVIGVPVGTVTNEITINLDVLPTGADGWKIYRRSPLDDDYYFLADVASGATEFVDDGSINPDCTKKRPASNTTNSANSITVAIDPLDFPLDDRVGSWRIYRSPNGVWTGSTLLASVSDTVTQGGSDLVTSFEDIGFGTTSGTPLEQSAVPPVVPLLDASEVFDLLGGRLPASLAPAGVRQLHTFLPGVLSAQTYNQLLLPHDMRVERLDLFFLTAPTGVGGANNVVVRVKDTALVDEVQHLWTDAEISDEVQKLHTDADGGTFTLSDGVDTTLAIDFNANATTIKTRLETDIASIVEVFVSGSGTVFDPWFIRWLNPAATNVATLVADDTLLTNGTATITTSVEGSDGGTFTLSDGVDTTLAIAYDADAATIALRLETDITSITDVTVTGAGTEEDPWVITYVNPGDQDVDLLELDYTLLNGTATIVEIVKGHGNTIVDLVCDASQQYHFWQSSETESDILEAEDGTGDGTIVSDAGALNDSAVELAVLNEIREVNPGILDPGDYEAIFRVSDHDALASFQISVIDAVGPTTLASATYAPGRTGYEERKLSFTSTGVEDIVLRVEKTDATANRVRVDRFEYEALLPTFLSGETLTVEVLINGAPTTNGSDAQLNVWY